MNIDPVFSKKQLSQIDSLFKHYKETVEPHHTSNWNRGVPYFFVLLALLSIGYLFQTKKISIPRKVGRNTVWVVFWAVLLWFFCLTLSQFNIIHFKNEDPLVSEGDWFFISMSIIGIIGAIWAIYARIDAEKAFNEAKEAKDEAIKTYNSFGSSFDFLDILDNTKEALPFIVDKIGASGSVVSLYIGFPCIGYLSKENKIHHQENVPKIFNDFLLKLESLVNATEKFVLNLAVFDRVSIENYKMGNAPLIHGGNDLFEGYFNVLRRLDDAINDPNNPWSKEKEINIIKITPEIEKFRFASVSQHHQRKKERGLIWVIPDLKPSKGFDSAGFETHDFNIVNMLQKVFDCSLKDENFKWAYDEQFEIRTNIQQL